MVGFFSFFVHYRIIKCFSSILVLAALGIGIGIGAGIWKTESIAATTTVNPEITTTIVTSARLGWEM
jgi:hypothetical protein